MTQKARFGLVLSNRAVVMGGADAQDLLAWRASRAASLEPRPVQKPPPVWVVATPRLGDGWMTNAHPAGDFAELRRRILAYAPECGRRFEGLPCCVYTNVHIDDDREASFRESKAWLDAYYSMRRTREAVETAVALGSPERCVERLRSFVAAGATDLLLRFMAVDAAEQLRRCLRDVLPHLL